MSAAAALSAEGGAGPRVGRQWRLVVSLGGVFFILFALYAAVLGVLLPNQIQAINPATKTKALGIVFAITSVFSTVATPLAGALSDRTRTRYGRRTPWIVVGGTIGGVAIIAVPHGSGIVAITAIWVVAAITLNCMQPAITTIIADRFVPERRGFVSGVVGAAMTAGLSAGTIYGGLLAHDLPRAYLVLGMAIIAACLGFVILNREPHAELPPAAPFQIRSFLRSFWIDPRQHPDFAWAFFGRFTIYMGYQAIVTYLLYILQDHIGLNQADANVMIARLSSVTFVALVISGVFSGWLSDRLQRRKPLVFAAGVVMALAVAAPLLQPNTAGMFGYAVLIGLGYGAFMSVDLALMTQVLPADAGMGDDTGKDLGILTTAVNVPQIISPVLAATMLGLTSNNYPMLFVAAAGFVVIGAFLVLPIRSVR